MAENDPSVNKAVLFYPVDFSYKIIKGKAAIYMYGRTKEGKQICVVDHDFEPY